MIDVERAAMALMDKMSTDGHEVSYTQCREYAALVIAAATHVGGLGVDPSTWPTTLPGSPA